MNINAQELTLVRRNMKFGETPASQPTEPVAEPPVTKPESGLSALEAQAKSNIAFQGGAQSAKTVLGKLRNMAATHYLAAAMAFAAPAIMTSCDDEPIIVEKGDTIISNTINIDMSSWTAIFNQMLEQQKITNQQLTDMNAKLNQLYQLVLSGQITTEEFYEQMYEYMALSTLNQELIIDALVDQGKSLDEANQWLQDLIAAVESGEMTFSEAVDKIMTVLGSIENTLKDILTVVTEISDKITANHNEYMAAKEEELAILNKLHQDNKIEIQLLAHLLKSNKNLETIAKELNTNVESLKEQIKNNHEEIMEELSNLNPGEELYQKYEALFKALGLTITDAINMSKDELLAAIKAFQESTAQDAATIQAQIAKLGEQLNVIIDNTSGLQENFEKQQNYWINVLGNLEKGNQILDQIRTEQKVTNEYLASYKQDFADMKALQKSNNAYLVVINDNILALEKAIKEFDPQGGEGMTKEEFLSAMRELKPEFAAEFEAFILKYGFDKVPGDVLTIKDLLSEIKDAYKNQKGYGEQLDIIISLEAQILAFLQNADFSDPDYIAKLDQIIETLKNFKCNCQCGKDSTENDESIKDMEDIFS